MFSEIFSKLLQERNVSSYKLTKDTGINNGLISKWKDGSYIPTAENLVKLSTYFSVSIDYLMGIDPIPNQKSTTSHEVTVQDNESALKERLLEYIEVLPGRKLATLEPLLKLLSEEETIEDPFFSEANQARLIRASADMEAGVNISVHEIEADDD